MKNDNLKYLLGNSIERPEEELEEGVDLEKDATIQYYLAEIISAIDEDDFKQTYDLLKEILYKIDPIVRKMFCREVIEKLKELYEIEISDDEDFASVMTFLEFIEYDYLVFVSDVWKILGTDLRNLEIEGYCHLSGNKIIKIVENQIETHFISQLISEFLRTYNKEQFINLFIKWTKKSKMQIVLKLAEGEI